MCVNNRFIYNYIHFYCIYFQNQDTALHRAAYNGHLAIVKLLTAHKADVNSLNKVLLCSNGVTKPRPTQAWAMASIIELTEKENSS